MHNIKALKKTVKDAYEHLPSGSKFLASKSLGISETHLTNIIKGKPKNEAIYRDALKAIHKVSVSLVKDAQKNQDKIEAIIAKYNKEKEV